MIRYTASYCKINSNFIIAGIDTCDIDIPYMQAIKIVKNIINRGSYSLMSKFLQTQYKYELLSDDEYDAFVNSEKLNWHNVIKGAEESLDNPALDFYYNVLDEYLGEYVFVKQLILPEAPINEVIAKPKKEFENCSYDFYIPQINVVIEVDGKQHQTSKIQDDMRDKAFNGTVIRIDANDIRTRNDNLKKAMDVLYQRLINNELINIYKKNLDGKEIPKYKIELTQIIRLEMCFLEMLKNRNDYF